MADVPLPGRDSIDAQRDMFRLAAKEHGLTLAVLAKRAPISLSTLKGWNQGAAMPAWALFALGEAGVPDELLSLVADPFGRHVGTNETGDGDLDALHRESAHFSAEKLEAEADGVVTHIERGKLKHRARRIASVARRAAA